MTTHTIAEIADATGLAMVGDGAIAVRGACPPSDATEADLAIAMSTEFAEQLSESSARAAVIGADMDFQELGLQAAILAPRPRVALAGLTAVFAHDEDLAPDVHPSAVVDPSAVIGDDVWIGPFAVIGARATVGAGARISAHVTVGADAQVGAKTILRAGVRIGARCQVGAHVLIHENAVIGADGFSFEPPQRGSVEAVRQTGAVTASNTMGFLRIHSLAAVVVGDHVEIGACTTLDRGTLSDTRIGAGTKIDNQVQIGHNVQVGKNCLLCAQVGIAGSAVIGDRVVLGGKVGIGDHLKIGSDVICAAGTLCGTDIPEKSVMMGIPAVPRDQALKQFLAIRRLPRLAEQVQDIRKRLGL